MLTIKDRKDFFGSRPRFLGSGNPLRPSKSFLVLMVQKLWLKAKKHQIVKTVRDCLGVKHQNFEKQNSLHYFLYPSTTFKKL